MPLRYYAGMRTRATLLLLLATWSAACTRPEKKAQAARPNWLADIPYVGQSTIVDTTGAPDVQHVVLLSPKPLDSVAAFYRTRLPPAGWRVVSDMGDSVRVSLYLERKGRPLWIELDAQGLETRVSFTAAGAAGPPQPAPGP